MLSDNIRLPSTPTVIARGNEVIIQYEDGSQLVWGFEETVEDAKRIAQELEIELKAINYIKWHVKTFIRDLTTMLESIGATEELLASIIRDGHSFAFNELGSTVFVTTDSIKELKELVSKKLDCPYII